ncbi:RusA family crossover junction endodeoxyribonuclease [Amycolatopsis sp. NPDC058340]|uniref:RusA family crossover junction endodeoxyribonuclease n=1 Tax=Amycolatopsis sp. NPDC058340 TaxID=3346453 RepID=UPI003663BCF1
MKAFANKKTGRPIIVKDNQARQKTWRADVRDALLDDFGGAPRTHFDGPVDIRLDFVLPRPKSTPKTRPTPAATKKPDLDKLIRAVFDAITESGMWTDDSAVVVVTATKRIAEIGEPSGCLIELCEAVAVAPSGERLVLL